MSDNTAAVLFARYLSPSDLASHGLSPHRIRRLVQSGALIRLRNGRYVGPDCLPALAAAARAGGRLDCVSLLTALGIFVRERHGPLHVQIDADSSRLPAPDAAIRRHWRHTACDRTRLAADIIEALAQACRCQAPRDAIATLDSAWHLGFVDEAGVAAVFARLPRRYRVLRALLDRRAEAGSESLVRLMVRALGCTVELQVDIQSVGRVDLLVDGWLIVECDSRAHHGSWEDRRRDTRRDLAAAALGYTTVRPIAEDVFDRPEVVFEMLRRTLDQRHTKTPPSRRSSRLRGRLSS